jgi:hypothetical protein
MLVLSRNLDVHWNRHRSAVCQKKTLCETSRFHIAEQIRIWLPPCGILAQLFHTFDFGR